MIDIVLIKPEESGNVGAVARAMANFGFEKLVLVEPLCSKDDEDARCRAKHAQQILKNAKIVNTEHLKKYDYLIGTTSKLGGKYNIPRGSITSKQLAEKLSKEKIKNKKINIALVFGREGIGMTNEEIQWCDFIVSIPSSKNYPALNLSHACAILFYELFQVLGKEETKLAPVIQPATKKDMEIVLMRFNHVLDKLSFSTKEKKQTQKIVWKRVFSKALMNRREAFAVIGLFKKIKDKIEKD